MSFSGTGTYKFVIDEPKSTKTQSASTLYDSKKSSDADVYEKKFARTIIWALGRNTVSNNTIISKEAGIKVSFHKANEFLDKLVTFNLVTKKDEENPKAQRKVVPKCIEDISIEVIELLDRNGYSETDIAHALNQAGRG